MASAMPTADQAPPRTATPVWDSARAIYGLLPPRLRRGWAVVIVLAGLCSLIELVTTALLLNVIRLATQPAGAGPRVLLPGVPLELAGAGTTVLATAVVAAVFLLKALLTLALTRATSSSTVGTGIFISETLLAYYVSMPYAAFRQRRVAELQRRVAIAAKSVASQVLRPGSQLVTDTAVIASVLAIMVIASPLGALAAAMLMVGVGVVLIRAINPRLYRTSTLIDQYDRSTDLFVEQVLHGRREITLRHHEEPVLTSYRDGREAHVAANRRRAILVDTPRVVIEGVTIILVTGLILSAIGLELDTPRVLATLALFAFALLRLMPLASRVATNVASFRAGLPFADVVLRDVLAVRDGVRSPTPGVSRPPGATPVPTATIEFRQVFSSYEGSCRPVLRNVTARIEAGSFVGVVGPSGAGKSTFVDLLLGLLVPTSGVVLVDGRPLQQLAAGWQAGVGVVSQEPYILNDSIRRNVVLFAECVDEERVVHVLQEVGLWPLVQQLPRGLDTPIGERGSALSGGQRQRLAVARALYLDPGLLVMDEATSALDPDGEAVVLRAAFRRERPRTVVAVTHRVSAIADCDQIIVLEDGEITAAGSYPDVLAKSAYFARLVSTAASGSLR
jgi:ATP-binding cassette, subfamily B, bacterial PglK